MNRKFAVPLISGAALSLSGCFNASFDWSSLCVGGIGCVGSTPITLTSISPGSPSNSSTTPTVQGEVSYPNAVTLTLYSDPGCSVPLGGAITPAIFSSTGSSVPISPNTTETFYAQATDGSALSSCVYLGTYTHDSLAPSVTLAAIPDPVNLANVASIPLTGACEDGLPVQIVGFSGAAAYSNTLSCSGGAFSAVVDLTSTSQGGFSLQARQTDAAGNMGNSSPQVSSKDTVAPALTVNALAGAVNAANAASFPVGGSCESPFPVVAGGAGVGSFPCSANAWSGTLNLTGAPETTITLSFSQTDGGGNTTTLNPTNPSFKDTGLPSVALSSYPAWINLANQAGYPVSGTCSEVGQMVEVKESGVSLGLAPCVGGGTWGMSVDLSAAAPGVRSLSAEHTDAAGNFNSMTVNPTKDAIPPGGYTFTGFVDGAWVTGNPITVNIVGGTGASDFDYFTDLTCTSFVGNTAIAPSFNWSLNQDALNELSFRFRDAAGNVSACSAVGTLRHTTATRAARYPTNGNDWNSFVSMTNPALPPHMQGDTACSAGTAAPGGFSRCMNGGEISKVDVLNCGAPCGSLAFNDTLMAFDWVCDDSALPNLTFHSTGLKPHKRLADLLNLAIPDFKNNLQFQVLGCSMGSALRFTEPKKWWNNAVQAAPSNPTGVPQVLGGLGVVHVVQGSTASNGYILSGAGASFVVAPGATLTLGNVTSGNCDGSTGGTGTSAVCLLSAPASASRIWIEGDFDGMGSSLQADATVMAIASGYVRLRKVSATNGALASILLDNVHNSRIEDALGTHSNGDGIWVSSSQYTEVLRSRAFNNLQAGFYLSGFQDGLAQGLISASNLNGFSVQFGGGSVFQALTAANNGDVGILLNGTSTSIFNNWATFNNSNVGLEVDNTSQLTIGQGVAAGSNYGVTSYHAGSSNNKYTGSMRVGVVSLQACAVSTDSGPGFSDMTCGSVGASNAAWSSIATGLGTFVETSLVGGEMTNDSGGGLTLYSSITDWLGFDNATRGWGKNAGFMSIGARGACTSATCAIWDLALLASDTRLRNTTGDGSSQNPAFSDGSACPAPVQGGAALVEHAGPNRAFLANAYEVVRVGSGNQNGLCESGETCLYTPNFGAYQGHLNVGQEPGICGFSNGAISNVKVLGLPNNGY